MCCRRRLCIYPVKDQTNKDENKPRINSRMGNALNTTMTNAPLVRDVKFLNGVIIYLKEECGTKEWARIQLKTEDPSDFRCYHCRNPPDDCYLNQNVVFEVSDIHVLSVQAC